ncbi:MAG: hypothetical protein WD934_01165 [Gemmatimonadales bacterium]
MTPAVDNRIRFEGVAITRPAPGQIRATVTLRWHNGEELQGLYDDQDTEIGVMRAVSAATSAALEQAVDDRVRLRLVGVKTVAAFDAILVVVALASRLDDHEQQLVGSCVIKEDVEHAAVRAVLSATNRLLGSNLIYLRW